LRRPALGIALGSPREPEEWAASLALVERADALGLHSVWVPEGHFQPGGTPAPLGVLAGFATRTRQLRLATTSILLPIHPPLRLAAEVASLDTLSGGRVLLGLGRGFRAPLFEAFGVDPRAKRDRFDASLALLRRAWAGEALPLGESPDAARVTLGVRPVQQPHPPLVVAAFGKKGLAQAARHGLPYLASPMEPLDVLVENYARWHENLAGELDPRAPHVPVMRTVHVARDDGEAGRVRSALQAALRPLRVAAPQALARAAQAPLHERVLVGTRGEVADGLARYQEMLGLDLLIARVGAPGSAPTEQHAALERLAELVLG